tara:strand:+ start:55901 stop:60247 length:4347 start_codon:yes stop_codon:yes gene_type:complete
MLSRIINFSLHNKLIVLLFTVFIIGFGVYSITQIPIGAVPDITNNQVQVITTSENLSTEDMEQFITYPVELEMANLPGVKEIRSVSKFGLSVVTIVFEENLGTYLPRQLIAEKIKSASEKIPQGFGSPQMGPISTGLGEIYQYTLDTKPGFKDKYSATDLRTIQDWIVRRQLSGIPGAVEINSWGGYLKQYEVAINTRQLNAMNITATDVYKAIANNNSVAGGGYIEKVNQAYFIRGQGLVTSLDDIKNIIVKNEDGVPVYVKDVAKVGFGHATRYGAITANGEGEKVLGQVMMLKDANSNKVIKAVKERVNEISKTLPEGVYINPFLDRSLLIAKTTYTIAENLILGFLIVIFVVVLLLGNFRSGLVVASVIPLCLLFALSLMYIFGVDANLMSLGAIDFGIIIDGAVIIVEFIAARLILQHDSLQNLSRSETRKLRNKITSEGASNMMNSAVFGQLIILIVFIPILSLSNVEGKMFRPMALVFIFALIGAMIFCLTYVPVISSLILKSRSASKRTISDKIMARLNRVYDPVIRWALKSKKIVIGVAALLLGITAYIFTTMGGEFIPTLDEGDFVIQPILKTGTSLSKTIETTTKIEQILLDNFPEVEQVVTRIGAAEVPTDPMSMEECDVIITLKPKDEWVSADSKDGLAEKFNEALAVIPGMEVEYTQPIEMRFNELITGVRADIAIKVFGEDLDILNKKGNQIKELIKDVPGAADISVEKIAGLPQMNVKYKREKIARYGLNIADLNQIIAMGFSGQTAGSVFEGEKRFDLVLRLEQTSRQDISNLENLYVDTPHAGKIPLSELADISYTKAAAKISRDDTKRRIVVGVNVRDRDLESVVEDIRKLVEENVDLPVGYTVEYGGQFENLQSATARLKIAVPISLVLIFVLLYFAFNSVKEALIIYSAIPLAAVGGVFFLWVRGLPFSISAGVGFIALFGIAVLNGIVLIEHFKELKKEGIKNINDMITTGAKDRLRAVLLTASAAALGFLPMAISTSAGAEVQRPLATVVIGGLITSTLLTLVVLPVLYALLEEKVKKPKNGSLGNNTAKGIAGLFLLLGLGSFSANAQNSPLNFDQVRNMALENNAGLRASSLNASEANTLISSAFDFDKTELYYSYDENNLAPNGKPLEVFGVHQTFAFPTVYFAQKKVNKATYAMASSRYDIQKRTIERQVASSYYSLQYQQEKEKIYQYLDSLYENFAYAAKRRFELGETNYLEKITAEAKQKQIYLQHKQALEDIKAATEQLQKVTQSDSVFQVNKGPLQKLEVEDFGLQNNPSLAYYANQENLYLAQSKFAKQQLLPDLMLTYFQGSNPTLNKNLQGYQLGMRIPLLFGGSVAKIKAAKIASQAATAEAQNYKIQLNAEYIQLKTELHKYEEVVNYYEKEGRQLSSELLKTATLSYQNGEIDFFQYIQSLENAYEIELSYLENLNAYNQTVIRINYLIL